MEMPKVAPEHVDFMKAQVDKFILIGWITFLALMLVHFTHHHEEAAYSWTVRAYDNIQGALLMLLTGGRGIQRAADRNGNGNGNGNGAKVEPAK